MNVVEIGIYSGGSLDMWSSYFGDQCHIYGVDIEDACKTYERDNVSVFVEIKRTERFGLGSRSRYPTLTS